MKFSEMIEKFKKGELSGEEAAALKADIEKHEAIADYIAERDEADFAELGNDISTEEGADEKASDFTKKIRRQIRRSFIKAGVITGAIVLAAVMFVMFALPGLVSKAYYDPSEVVLKRSNGVETTRLGLDLSVYTELFVPARIRQQATANAEGYGNYSIYIPQVQSYSGNFRDTAGYIRKGKLTLYDPGLLKLPPVNCFESHKAGVTGDTYESGWDFDSAEFINYFPKNGLRAVCVTLDHVMSFDEFGEWCTENDVEPYWCTVCSNGASCTPYSIGFLCSAPVSFSDITDEVMYAGYPLLTGEEMLSKRSTTAPLSYNEADIRQHLVSMLRYAGDNFDAMTMLMGTTEGEKQYLQNSIGSAADSIEKNGFEIYGFIVYADIARAEELAGIDGVLSMFDMCAAE